MDGEGCGEKKKRKERGREVSFFIEVCPKPIIFLGTSKGTYSL